MLPLKLLSMTQRNYGDDEMIKICKECGNSYMYFDSPPQKKCFCGGELREATIEEETEAYQYLSTSNHAVVSC